MTTDTTTTTTKPAAVPTAKVFAGYVDELMAAGSAVEKVAAKIALAATRQAAHRASLTYLNAAHAAFRACHLTYHSGGYPRHRGTTWKGERLFCCFVYSSLNSLNMDFTILSAS